MPLPSRSRTPAAAALAGVALTSVALAACASVSSSGAPSPSLSSSSAAPPSPDPRVGLAAGRTDSVVIDGQPRRVISAKAAETIWHLRLLSNTPRERWVEGRTGLRLAALTSVADALLERARGGATAGTRSVSQR